MASYIYKHIMANLHKLIALYIYKHIMFGVESTGLSCVAKPERIHANGLTETPAPSRWRIRSLRDKQRPNSSLPSYASCCSSFYRGSSAPVVKFAPNTMFPFGRSAKWRRPSRRHCVRYCIKCALVCESLKTVLDASTFLDGPSLRVETILRRPEVRRRS
jgi:hypothetical protein